MDYVQLVKGRIRPVASKLMGVADLPATPLLRNLTEDQLKVFGIYALHDMIDYDPRTHVIGPISIAYDAVTDTVAKTAAPTKKKVADLRKEIIGVGHDGSDIGVIPEMTARYRNSSVKVTVSSGTYIACSHDYGRDQLLKNAELASKGEFPTDFSGALLDHYPLPVKTEAGEETTLELDGDAILLMKSQYDEFQDGITAAYESFKTALGSMSFNDIWPAVDGYFDTLPETGDHYLQSLTEGVPSGV